MLLRAPVRSLVGHSCDAAREMAPQALGCAVRLSVVNAHRSIAEVPEPSSGIVSIKAVRGSVLLSSQQSLREAGLFDRYIELLDPSHKDAVLGALASEWLPLDTALVHFRACDGLNLSDSAIETLARSSGTRMNTIYLRGMLRLTDTTPRFAWSHAQRIWARTWAGSFLEVTDAGPKDVRVELTNSPCCEIPYFRKALGAFFARNTELFCRRAFWKPVPGLRQPNSAAYIISWV